MLCINLCSFYSFINLVCFNKPASAWEMSSIIFLFPFFFSFNHPPPHPLSHTTLPHTLTHSPYNPPLPPPPTPPFTTSPPPASTPFFALCVKSPEPKGSESQPTPVTNKETLGSHLTAERLGGSVQVLLLLLLLLL